MEQEIIKAFSEAIRVHNDVIVGLRNELEELKRIMKQLDERPLILAMCTVDHAKTDYDIELFKRKERKAPVFKDGRKLVVSLTSFPQRMYDLKYTLYSLASQSLQPDRIVLWLTREEFPCGEEDIALSLRKLIDRFGVEIKWTEKNYRAHNKYLGSFLEFSR